MADGVPVQTLHMEDDCWLIHYCKTWIFKDKCQKIHLDFTYNPSKASIFNTVKNYWYPDHLPYLLRSSRMVPLQLSHLPCSSMLSTPPPCAWNVWWLLTTSEGSWQLYGVTRSDTYGHVAVELCGECPRHVSEMSPRHDNVAKFWWQGPCCMTSAQPVPIYRAQSCVVMVCHCSTICTSKAVNQHADDHSSHFSIAKMAQTRQWDFHIRTITPFYLHEFIEFSAKSWHIVFLPIAATQHRRSPPKDRLVVASRWVLHFLLAQLFNWKLPQLTLPFLPTPLPHVIKHQRPSLHPSRATALPSKKESCPLLTRLVSSPIFFFCLSTL